MKVVACSICSIEDGKGFVADMQAYDGAGNAMAIPGNQYSLVLYLGVGEGEEAVRIDGRSESRVVEIRMGRCRTYTATSRMAPRQFVDQASIRAIFDSSIVRRESCATVGAHTVGALQ